METEPYAVRRVIESDGREHVLVWEKYTNTPDIFGLIAGDAIHNLRSSLDHLAVALAIAGANEKGVVMSSDELASIQFPIVIYEDDFVKQNKRKDRLRHVVDGARAYIESVQPYVRLKQNPRITPLFVLSDLDNADKHRLITTAVTKPILWRTNWPTDFKNAEPEYPQGELSNEVGAELCRFRFSTPQSEMDVPIELEWGVALWLGPAWSNADVAIVIRELIKEVRSIAWSLSLQFIPPLNVKPAAES